jgi:hypothetical protein
MKFLSDILAKAGLTVDGVVTLNNTATGQTPAANDNSTKLATTAWVRTFVQPYSLPIASASILGGIKVGSGLSIDSGTGILSVTGGGAASIKSTQTFIATAGQTVFTITGGYTPTLIDVFLNGVYLSPNQTTATNGTTVTLAEAALVGDIIDVIVASPIYEGATTTTDQLPEGVVNLYYTNARARAAISLTVTGSSGASTYDSATGVLNVPTYTLAGLGGVPTGRTITIDGVSYDLSANRTWNILPTGGVAGDILAKNSATNYDVAWIPNYTSQVQHQVKLGATMTVGTAVYVSGSTGGSGTNMIVSKASNASEATSSKTLGLLKTGGITNDEVFVVTEGLLAGLDTSTANAGDPVWLGINGALIFGLLNKPTAPAHLVFIGVVTRVQSNNGEIFVKVQNGFELDELHDLSVKNPSDGDMIKYVASTGLWTKIAASTTNIVEGTNLYYTQGRFDTAFAAKSTTNLAEGANLYYTDARVGTYLTNNSYATQTYVNTAVSNLVDAAPGTLDTLNELAAALGDDPNFATTVATSIGTKEPAITAGTTSQYWRGDKTWQTLPVYTLSGLGGVPTTRSLTINGTAYDLSADRSWTINSMVYPGAGIPVSTGTAWGTSITNNSANWNTAYGWGNHASAGYLTSYTETDTLASVTGRGATSTTTITINSSDWYGYATNNGSGITAPRGAFFANAYPSTTDRYYAQFSGNWASSLTWGLGVRGTGDDSIYFARNTSGVLDVSSAIKLYVGPGLVLHTSNYSTYALPITGGSLTGNLTFSTQGSKIIFGDSTTASPSMIGEGLVNTEGTDSDFLTIYFRNSLRVYSQTSEIGRFTSTGLRVYGSIIKDGGTSAQFLKADGSVDSSTYATTSDLGIYLPLAGGTLTGLVSGTGNGTHYFYTYGRTGLPNAGKILYNNGTGSNMFFGEIGTDIYGFTNNLYSDIPTLAMNVSSRKVTINGNDPTGTLTIQARADGNMFSIRGSISGYSYPNIVEMGQSGADGYLNVKDGAGNIQSVISGYSGTPTYFLSSLLVGISASSGYKFEVKTSTYNRLVSFFSGSYTSGFKFSDLNGGIKYDAGIDTLELFSDYAASGKIVLSTAGTARLSIATSGAATFSDNVSISGTARVYNTLTFAGGDRKLECAESGGVAFYSNEINANAQGVTGSLYFGWRGTNTINVGVPMVAINYIKSTQFQTTASGSNTVYNLVDATNTYTGAYAIQAGAGSSGWGGSLTLYGHSHASRAGFVSAGISSGSNGKFTVMNSAIGAGSDIFTVDVSGNVVSSGIITAGSGINLGSGVVKMRWGGNTTPTLGHNIGGSDTGNSFHIEVSDGDTGGLIIQNDGTTVYGAGDAGFVFRVIDEDSFQGGGSAEDNTCFKVNQGAGGGGYIKGTFTATGDVVAYSDIRVKENIKPLTSALSKVLELNGYFYNRTDLKDKSTKIGFIAQEVEKVVPELVTYDSLQDKYAVSYGNTTALLVEAIKEQQAQIESQKTEIEELKDLVKQLINR